MGVLWGVRPLPLFVLGGQSSSVCNPLLSVLHRLVGRVVEASASRVADPGFDPRGDFPGSARGRVVGCPSTAALCPRKSVQLCL